MLDIAQSPLAAIIKEGRLLITPDLAQRILNEAFFERQRRIDEKQVQVYATMMRRGLWHLADPISFVLSRGKLTAVNGYHRLHAIIAFGRAVEFRIAINVAQSEEEIASTYYRFDTVIKTRSHRQILGAVNVAESNGVSRNMAEAVYGAAGVIMNDFVVPKATTLDAEAAVKMRVVDLRLEACAPWWEHARALEKALAKAPANIRRRILRATTFSVALVTQKHQAQKAQEFWRGLAENDGLRRTDPRNTYLRDLLTRTVSLGDAQQGVMAAALAWNAWCEGRSLSIIKIAPGMKFRLAGTPYNGIRG